MRLTKDSLARDFSAPDITNTPVRLSDYRGKKIILGFYRNVECPFCSRRIHRIKYSV